MDTGVQLGGLYKKATYLEQYRKNHTGLVVVDSGDLLNEDEELPESIQQSAKLKAELMVQLYKTIGIDAANIGELDLALGIDYLKELEKKNDFPFISANLVNANNETIFKRYVIKKAGAKTVGILGVIGDTSEMAAKVSEISKGAASVTDALQAAEAVVKELTGKVDYIVVLTHQVANRDWVIARRVTGIDLVVGGHDKLKTKDPLEADKTLIVRAGEKGQYQGMLEVSLEAARTSTNTLVPYDDAIADDPKIKAMISAYNDKVADIYGGGADAKPVNTNVTLKNDACGTCHADQVKKWKESEHAHAYATLVGKSKNFDPKCLSCHTVRFEQPDGFSMKQQQMELVNVQCESCHGNAKDHLSSMKPIPTPKPTIQMCVKCHTADRCPTFIQDEKIVMDKIKH